jgi:hypothetical protein
MALKDLFDEQKNVKRPLRVLVYGASKNGKSHFVATAADIGPLFWIDTEHGSDFYNAERAHGFKVKKTSDVDFAIQAIRAADAEARNGSGPTPIVAIDSFSSTWYDQKEVAEKLTVSFGRSKNAQTSSRASFRAWGPAKRPLQALYNAIQGTVCHVIITARAKEDFVVDDSGAPKESLGLVPDMEKNLPYAVDIVLEVRHTTDGFEAIVRGTRTPQEEGWGRGKPLPIGTRFRNPKFADLMVALVEGTEGPGMVDDAISRQIETAERNPDIPATFGELWSWCRLNKLDVDAAKAWLREHFEKQDPSMVYEYYIGLRDNLLKESNASAATAAEHSGTED